MDWRETVAARQQSTREAATRPGWHATNASAVVEELITLVIHSLLDDDQEGMR